MKFGEFCRAMISAWRLHLGSFLFALALAFCLIWLLPVRYESSAVVKIGSKLGDSSVIESFSSLAEKVRSTNYILESGAAKKQADADEIRSALQIKDIGDGYVSLSYRDKSRDAALFTLDKLLSFVISEHRKILLLELTEFRSRVTLLREADSERGRKIRENAYAFCEKNFESQCVSFLAATTERESNMVDLQQKLVDFESHNTKLSVKVNAMGKPVFPNKALIFIICIMTGIFFSIVLVMKKNKIL